MENDITPFCAEKIRQLDEHLKDSPERIAEIAKTKEQVSNLLKDHEDVMEDIKGININVGSIKEEVAGIKTKIVENQAETSMAIKNVANEVKLWVVSGIVIGLLGLSGTILASIGAFGNMNLHLGENVRQIDIDTKRIDVLEQVERNTPKETLTTETITTKTKE